MRDLKFINHSIFLFGPRGTGKSTWVKEIIKDIEMQIPYPWAKPMIYVDNVDNSDYLKEIIKATYQELK